MPAFDQSEPPLLNTHNALEVYPMPMFAALETSEVDALAQWYQDALGFSILFRMPGPDGQPVMVHLRRQKYQDVLIRAAPVGDDSRPAGGLALCFQSGEDVDQLAARAAVATDPGTAQVETVADTPWNTRQVRIIDPEGRMLVFSQPRFDPELTRRMQEMFQANKEAGP